MRTRTLVLALAAAALLTPAAALAKGPESATMTGPGLERPITFKGGGEPGSVGTLGRTAEAAGLFAAMFGQTPDPMLKRRPAGALGPRYTITYRLPGPNNELDLIRQDVYPKAAGGAVTYTPPGQPFFTTERTRGGWFVGGSELEGVLIEAGLPSAERPPAAPPIADDGGFELPTAILPIAAVCFVVGLALYALIRRQPTPRPR